MQDTGLALAGNGPIPAIGCGTWELRGETCAQIVAKAIRVGYRHIDTAQGYSNEEAVGEGLRASGIPRSDVFITTKVRPQRVSDGDLQLSAEESLLKLGVDVVDLSLLRTLPHRGLAQHRRIEFHHHDAAVSIANHLDRRGSRQRGGSGDLLPDRARQGGRRPVIAERQASPKSASRAHDPAAGMPSARRMKWTG
jgi:hypothetical protein